MPGDVHSRPSKRSLQNSQPWHFIAITDKAILKDISECGEWAGHLAGAALGVALLSEDPAEKFQRLFDLGQAIAQQQNPRFLQSPYYGSKGLSSWFDHQVPTYAIDHALVIYTGDSRAVDDNETCFSGWNGNCYDGHPGIDFLTGYDQILAAADGQVIWAGWPSPLICHNGPICGLGLHIIIEHNINNVVYRTIYGHLSVIGVQEGDNIKAGQVIGSSGSTGSSTGPHLHFEVQVFENNLYRRIDPFGWQTPHSAPLRVEKIAFLHLRAE